MCINLVHHGAVRVPSSFASGARCEAADEMLLDFPAMHMRIPRRFAIPEVADHTQEIEL